MANIFSSNAITETSDIVIYDDGTQKYATRIQWVLTYLGAELLAATAYVRDDKDDPNVILIDVGVSGQDGNHRRVVSLKSGGHRRINVIAGCKTWQPNQTANAFRDQPNSARYSHFYGLL